MKLVLAVLLLLSVFVQERLAHEEYWTGWLDRDDPSVFGDFETYRGFEHPPCAPTYSPVDAQCRVIATKKPWYTANKFIVRNHHCTPKGLACRNREQPGCPQGKICCPDFEIKFLCYKPGIVKPTTVTESPTRAPKMVNSTASPVNNTSI